MADTNGEANGGASATEPVQHKSHHVDSVALRAADKAGHLQDRKEQLAQKKDGIKGKGEDKDEGKGEGKGEGEEKKEPNGGFDSTPVPRQPVGWTVRITFHRAVNLPAADINSLSSDPFILAQINHGLPTRHKQDPPLRLRTPTVRRDCNPVWDCDWVLCNVPASGFELKARIYDEDPADHDDRLGNVHVHVRNLSEGWAGIREQSYKIKKRMGSKRAYLLRACTAFFEKDVPMSGELVVSVQLLGRTEDTHGGHIYTLGPCAWSQHFSPMIGRLVGMKEPEKKVKNGDEPEKKRNESYNFQANQLQLRGPVPEELYHRYVEFRPFVKGMFNGKSLQGRILNRALHHQHARIYNYDRTTVYGSFPEPSLDMTKQFLDLVHYDEGARIYTYVLTLDGQWRFTETGPEFSIDLLSKHTMHSDVNIYIAFSGEFFIRRLRGGSSSVGDSNGASASGEGGESPQADNDDDTVSPEPSKHHHKVGQYQLIIDNDSGTYRPNQDMLPKLKEFLGRNLPGLNIMTLSCVDDEEKMNKMKSEQRERKKNEGTGVAMAQVDDSSSVSSSDEEDLDRAAGEDVPRRHGSKMRRRVSNSKSAVRGWAHRDGHHAQQKDAGASLQVPDGEAVAPAEGELNEKREDHTEKREERHEERREEKTEHEVAEAEAKTGTSEGNKEQGSADAVDLEGPGPGAEHVAPS